MIYLFTHVDDEDISTIHKFYHDGKIYMHSISDNKYHVDEDYTVMSLKTVDIHKFEYVLPNELIKQNGFGNMTYTEITDYYITRAIFKDL